MLTGPMLTDEALELLRQVADEGIERVGQLAVESVLRNGVDDTLWALAVGEELAWESKGMAEHEGVQVL